MPPEAAFAFLADLENHWRLTGRAIGIDELAGPPGARTGGVVTLRGPLGLRRRVRTRMLEAAEPRWMVGIAEVGRETLAGISWRLAASPARTSVELRAEIVYLSRFDRVLWRLGARRWMERLFSQALVALEAELAAGVAHRSGPGKSALPQGDLALGRS